MVVIVDLALVKVDYSYKGGFMFYILFYALLFHLLYHNYSSMSIDTSISVCRTA